MRHLTWLLIALIIAAIPRPARAAATETYTDPFQYCAAVGTVDAPDARWTGEKVPMAVAVGLRKALNLPPEEIPEQFIRSTFWRCMGGKVYACNVGANIPCQAKANTSRVPTPAMHQWCQQNPDSDFIPMYVRDRASIYDWACRGTIPVITRQITEPDAAGFLKNVWYLIQP